MNHIVVERSLNHRIERDKQGGYKKIRTVYRSCHGGCGIIAGKNRNLLPFM